MYEGYFPPGGRHELLRPPPFTFTDGEARTIEIRVFGDGPVRDELEALVEMYLAFDSAYRSLGLPPVGERRVRDWLEDVVTDYCLVAWHDDRAVGHAVLVADGPDDYELAIFLHQAYHGAGIGTHLLEALLTYGRDHGVSHVWLIVERGNRPARNLYNDVGFVVTDETRDYITMAVAM